MTEITYYNLEYLTNFVQENNITLLHDYSNDKVTRETRIKAKCSQCDEPMVAKCFRSLVKNKNFGCKKHANAEQLKKSKVTSNKNYGTDHPMQNKEFLKKLEDKVEEKCGKRCIFATDEFKEKVKEHWETLGVTNPSQLEEVKEKRKETWQKNYNVDHPLQDPTISQKVSNSRFKFKPYTLPSGKVIKVQGYENFALDYLFKVEKLNEEDIIIDRGLVPEVWYKDGVKRRRYFVDIYIPSQNRCIEVKSPWTMKLEKELVFVKRDALVKKGCKCEIWIINYKGVIVERI